MRRAFSLLVLLGFTITPLASGSIRVPKVFQSFEFRVGDYAFSFAETERVVVEPLQTRIGSGRQVTMRLHRLSSGGHRGVTFPIALNVLLGAALFLALLGLALLWPRPRKKLI